MTGDIDTAAASADGKTYTNPKSMTTIVSGGAGNREDESNYVKTAESATGGEIREAAEAAVNRAHSSPRAIPTESSSLPAFSFFPPPLLSSRELRLGHLPGAERHPRDMVLAHVGRQQGPRGLGRLADDHSDWPRALSGARSGPVVVRGC